MSEAPILQSKLQFKDETSKSSFKSLRYGYLYYNLIFLLAPFIMISLLIINQYNSYENTIETDLSVIDMRSSNIINDGLTTTGENLEALSLEFTKGLLRAKEDKSYLQYINTQEQLDFHTGKKQLIFKLTSYPNIPEDKTPFVAVSNDKDISHAKEYVGATIYSLDNIYNLLGGFKYAKQIMFYSKDGTLISTRGMNYLYNADSDGTRNCLSRLKDDFAGYSMNHSQRKSDILNKFTVIDKVLNKDSCSRNDYIYVTKAIFINGIRQGFLSLALDNSTYLKFLSNSYSNTLFTLFSHDYKSRFSFGKAHSLMIFNPNHKVLYSSISEVGNISQYIETREKLLKLLKTPDYNHTSSYDLSHLEINQVKPIVGTDWIVGQSFSLHTNIIMMLIERYYLIIHLTIIVWLLVTFLSFYFSYRNFIVPANTLLTYIHKAIMGNETNRFYYKRILSKKLPDPWDSWLNSISETIEVYMDQKQELYDMAYFDRSTQMGNANMLEDYISQALDREEVKSGEEDLWVLYINIHNLHKMTYSYGFYETQDFLRSISNRIGENITPFDVVVRLSNDKYAIVLNRHGDSEADLNRIIAKIHENISLPFVFRETKYVLEFYIGAANAPKDATSYHWLMQFSYQACVLARDTKTPFRLYETKMQDKFSVKYRIENDIRQAIANNEFVLYYQPQIDSKTNKIVGVEALIRWFRDGKMVSPGIFMPVVEEVDGLMLELGEWVIKQACFDARRMCSIFGQKQFKVAFNVSAVQMKDASLIQIVRECISEFEIPQGIMCLEITESAFVDDMSFATQMLTTIRQMGVKISLDDFGTGYSSLSYLSVLPLDFLKIDRAFVLEAEKQKTSEAILQKIIELADLLLVGTVIEGVETTEQLSLIKELCGHRVIQGFYYSKPISLSDLIRSVNKETMVLEPKK